MGTRQEDERATEYSCESAGFHDKKTLGMIGAASRLTDFSRRVGWRSTRR